MKKIMLGTSDTWLMSRLSYRPSEQVYYIEDCRISDCKLIFQQVLNSWKKVLLKMNWKSETWASWPKFDIAICHIMFFWNLVNRQSCTLIALCVNMDAFRLHLGIFTANIFARFFLHCLENRMFFMVSMV